MSRPELYTHQRHEIALETFQEACARFGKPKEVLSDQGRQYFAWRGKSEFEKLLGREGVKHVVARAQHPETVGKCERFWERLKRELWDRVHPKDLEEARERVKQLIAHHNHFRPHQSLDGMVPAARDLARADAIVDRDVFYAAACSAMDAAERGLKDRRAVLKARRGALFATLVRFGLATRHVGKRPRVRPGPAPCNAAQERVE